MLEHVVAAVRDVGRQTEDVAAYARGAVDADSVRERVIRIEELRAKHVMGRQRATHANATGERADVDAAPAIELF